MPWLKTAKKTFTPQADGVLGDGPTGTYSSCNQVSYAGYKQYQKAKYLNVHCAFLALLTRKKSMDHLELIVDQSGSMAPIVSTVFEGARELLAGLSESGTTRLTRFHSVVTRGELQRKSDADFAPAACDGATALYDALCSTLDLMFGEDYEGRTVVVAVVTDGLENASGRTQAETRAKVEEANRRGWRVTFLGANQDAVLTARDLGIRAERALTYGTTARETREAFRSLSAGNARFVSGEREGFTPLERARSYRPAEEEVWVSLDPRSGVLQRYDPVASSQLSTALATGQLSCEIRVGSIPARVHFGAGGQHVQTTSTGVRDVRCAPLGETLFSVCITEGYRLANVGSPVIVS